MRIGSHAFLLFILSISSYASRDFQDEYSLAVEFILDKCPEPYPQQQKSCGLQAIHKAVLRENKGEIERLLKKGHRIEAKAKRQWTPAHFAALLPTRDMLEFLYSFGASKNSLDTQGGTPEHIWNLTHLTDQHRINIWSETEEVVDSVDSEMFTALTGARFVESIKISPKKLAELWRFGFTLKDTDPATLLFYSEVKNSYSKTTRQDDVYLRKMPANMGYGLYALRKFSPGEVIGEYQGEFTGELLEQDSEYSTQHTNGAHLRGYTAFASHGMPNAIISGVKDARGLPLAEILVATREIHPHKPILWAYGTHDVIWEMYHEFQPNALDDYLQKNKFELTNPTTFVDYGRNLVFTYILTTPTVFYRLLFENRFSSTELSYIQKAINNLPEIFKDPLGSAINFVNTLQSSEKERVFPFLAQKAREGNMQIMHQFIVNFHPSETDLERKWKENWINFCKYHTKTPFFNAHTKRGDCLTLMNLQKQQRDEL